MAVATFIPEVWAREVLVNLTQTLVIGQSTVVNRDYQGEVGGVGDTVHIPSLVDPTVAAYVRNVTVIDPQTLDTTDQTLLIDQSQYFAFEVDDVDAAQVAGNLIPVATAAAARRLAEVADAYLAGLLVAGAGSTVATAVEFDTFVDMVTALDTANVPRSGRFALVSPAVAGTLLKSDEFQRMGPIGDDAIANGQLGNIAGLVVMVTQALGTTEAIVGHPIATTYVEQVNKVEAYRPDNAFADAIKGLHLYGAKVVRPAALVKLEVV